ncbi:hypothetical protein, partial [Xanthomarina gelatinilytica]|uniref:hypothetical protein n=1 Tax=Xanthomarina gelatinilytica TaxID=1137281 RepID=UPI003AA8745E
TCWTGWILETVICNGTTEKVGVREKDKNRRRRRSFFIILYNLTDNLKIWYFGNEYLVKHS